MNNNERFGQIEAMLADLLRRMDRQSEQIDKIIDILKLSDERQSRMEERQVRAEERQDRFEQRQDRFEERQETLLTEIKTQGQRIETMLDTQMGMINLMSRQANRTDVLEQRVATVVAFENRVQRLEDAVFNKAS